MKTDNSNNKIYPEDIDLSNVEFQKAYKLIEKTNQTFFLTGNWTFAHKI